MRRRVIAAEQPREHGFAMERRAPLAAVVLIVAAAVIGVVSWRGPASREPIEIGSPGRGSGEPATRQLIFETPGGTRVIWVFNPEFRE